MLQSKTNTALQTDSKFFRAPCYVYYCVVVLVVDRGEAELKASSEVNMDEQGALEQVGRAGHNQASVGYSSPCVYCTHGWDCTVEWFCCFEWLAAAEETLRHWSCSCRPGAKQTKAFPSSELFSMSMFRLPQFSWLHTLWNQQNIHGMNNYIEWIILTIVLALPWRRTWTYLH